MSYLNPQTDAEIKAANLRHAQLIKARVQDPKTVTKYVKFINHPKGTK